MTMTMVRVMSKSDYPTSVLIFRKQFLQDIELPNTFTSELRDLLESLLQREVDTRLGCLGRG